jgi:hypothetical protein
MSPLIEQDLSHLSDVELNRQLHERAAALMAGMNVSDIDKSGHNVSYPNYTGDRTLTREAVDNAIASAYQTDFGMVLNRMDLAGRRYLVLHEKRSLKPINRVLVGPRGESRAYAELALLRLLSLAETYGR